MSAEVQPFISVGMRLPMFVSTLSIRKFLLFAQKCCILCYVIVHYTRLLVGPEVCHFKSSKFSSGRSVLNTSLQKGLLQFS